MTTMTNSKYHPACLLLPEMGEEEYRELLKDIRSNGLRHPILVDEDGVILDGRHRERACRELGIEPRTETFIAERGEVNKIALIMSENVHRRHLTVQQRAAIAAELSEKLREASIERMRAGKNITAIEAGADKTLASVDARGKSTEQAAAMVGGVSTSSVERAKRRMQTDPEAHAKAKAGTLGKRRPKDPIREPRETPPKPAPVADLALDLAKLNAAWSTPAVEKYAGSMTEQQAGTILSHRDDLRAKLSQVFITAASLVNHKEMQSEAADSAPRPAARRVTVTQSGARVSGPPARSAG